MNEEKKFTEVKHDLNCDILYRSSNCKMLKYSTFA